MELSWKIRNLSLCRKIFEHCHFVQNFPSVPEMKIPSYPSPLGYGIFFSSNGLRKYAIRVYVEKYLKIFFSLRKFNPTIHHWATVFFQIVLELRNLSWWSKIIEHCHFVQNFPTGSAMISKIQSRSPISIGLRDFILRMVFKNTQFGFM